MRISVIHALRQSPPPIAAAFARHWPEAIVQNILEDSLSADLVRDGGLTPAMTERFQRLARYAVDTGAEAILFSCSAFGPCIDAVRETLAPLPVRKPFDAMVAEAVKLGGRIGLISTFQPTLDSMPAEFPKGTELVPILVPGALAAFDAGDVATHDRLILEAARKIEGCDVLVLAQFSNAHCAPAVAEATGKRVLTTPDAAVLELKRTLLGE
jgi:hypothetical protein